jgi:hypothetical protein
MLGMTVRTLVMACIALAACAGRRAAPAREPEPAPEPELPEIEVEPAVEIDEMSASLQLEHAGGFVVVESGFQGPGGGVCAISLDSDGNLVTSVGLHAGPSCPYEPGAWKVPPQKVQELVMMLNGQVVLAPATGEGPGPVLQTEQGAYEVVPGGGADPVGEYLRGLYEAR